MGLITKMNILSLRKSWNKQKTSTDVQETPAVRIHALNGRIYCDGLDVFTIIDLAGQDVTAMNGSLHGIYVVIAGDMAKKVSVR